MRKRGEHGVILLTAVFFLAFFGICLNFFRLSRDREHVLAAAESSCITIHAGDTEGTIFDRDFKPLTNPRKYIAAVAVPSELKIKDVIGYAEDTDDFRRKWSEGRPFAFRCRKMGEDLPALTFFEIPEKYGDEILAPHILGYITENKGASGLEYAYERLLRSGNMENSVTYSTDGFGHILIGSGKSVIRSTKEKTGVVTTLDMDIQRIVEDAGSSIDRGAIIVSDVKNGDILGIASFPEYDVTDISGYLSSEKSPMINRALYSYSVGSIFKLVTACEGLNEDMDGFSCSCTGKYDIADQRFACHKYDGHGIQDMSEAMTNSCNPYFISLSQCLDLKAYRSLAYSLGFGREIHLATGMISSAGVLPTIDQLRIPAELANFSFGQGKLSATPLQVNQMTCAIANGGELVILRLIRGITVDGETVGNEKSPLRSRVISSETAKKLRKMMECVIYDNENSKAAPRYTRAAAKTSTAQTGRFDENGEEYCNGWITGFFPTGSPKYAVTVMVEDGGYGNETAAPIFTEIADRITRLKR